MSARFEFIRSYLKEIPPPLSVPPASERGESKFQLSDELGFKDDSSTGLIKINKWTGFPKFVFDTISKEDLSSKIFVVDAYRHISDYEFCYDREAVSARFERNIATPVTQAFLKLRPRSALVDSPGVLQEDLKLSADVYHPTNLKLAYPDTVTPLGKSKLKKQLGVFIRNIRCSGLKYGFITTYESTMFVRRTSDDRFELSLPISYNSTSPTIRECLFALALKAHREFEGEGYEESLELDINMIATSHEQVSSSDGELEAFADDMAHQTHDSWTPIFRLPGISMMTGEIVFDNGSEYDRIICNREPRKGMENTSMSYYDASLYTGHDCVVKVFSEPEYDRRYNNIRKLYEREVEVYEKLEMDWSHSYVRGLSTPQHLARVLSHGPIIRSSGPIPSKCYVIILDYLPDMWFKDIFDDKYLCDSVDISIIRVQYMIAVFRLQKSGYAFGYAPGNHQFLYDRFTGKVFLKDFHHTLCPLKSARMKISNFHIRAPSGRSTHAWTTSRQ